MEGEREILSVPSGLMCPISYDRMKDPVILIPSGNTYDCEQICKSLLHHPNLDPSSGVRYDSKLQYCDNLAVRQLLMETYGDKAFQKYDDSGFQTRYEKAWNSGNDGVAAATARVAAVIQTNDRGEREREQARRERDVAVAAAAAAAAAARAVLVANERGEREREQAIREREPYVQAHSWTPLDFGLAFVLSCLVMICVALIVLLPLCSALNCDVQADSGTFVMAFVLSCLFFISPR
jgi:hypothetical protein